MPTITIFNTRSAARRPHVRRAFPALVIGGGELSAEEETNFGLGGAMRTLEERDSWGGSWVAPEGSIFSKRGFL